MYLVRSSALGRFMKIFFEHYITKDAKENYLNFHQYFEVNNIIYIFA